MSTVDDESLYAGRLAQDEGATHLVAEYQPLLKYACRLTSNSAEALDLVHTVIIRALLQTQNITAPENLGAWLRTVLYRVFVDERRRATRETVSDISVLERSHTPDDSAPPPSWTRITVDEVRSTVSMLPVHFRQPYELFTFQHLSYHKIAETLGVPSRTVGTRINRARRMLRTMLLEARSHST